MELIYIILVVFSAAFAASQLKILSLRKQDKLKSAMILELQIEEILDDIAEKTCVDRPLLCKVHNGGPNIEVGSPKKISVIIEPKNSLQPLTKEEYQDFEIDSAYKRLLLDMFDSSLVYKVTTKMKPGFMQRKLEADGVTACLHIKSDGTKTGRYYLFFGTTGEANRLLGSSKDFSYIEARSQTINRLVKTAIKQKVLL